MLNYPDLSQLQEDIPGAWSNRLLDFYTQTLDTFLRSLGSSMENAKEFELVQYPNDLNSLHIRRLGKPVGSLTMEVSPEPPMYIRVVCRRVEP